MKKFLSVFLAVMMAVSVFAVSLIPAMADNTTVKSPSASPVGPSGPTLEVNGAPAGSDITYTEDEGDYSYKFNYVGGGTLLGWKDNLNDLGLVEGVDYTAVENADGTYTITLISETARSYWDNNQLIVDAIVKLNESTTAATSTNTNDSSKAPATGMSSSVLAGSVAVACAGVAVLAATKKKFSK